MKGMILPFAVTVMQLVVCAVVLVGVLVFSLFVRSATVHVVDVLASVEQPTITATGLLQMRGLDGRTTMDVALHASGGAAFEVPPLVTDAMRNWGIETWLFRIFSPGKMYQAGSPKFSDCTDGTQDGMCSFGECPAGGFTIDTGGAGATACGRSWKCCAEDYSDTAYKPTTSFKEGVVVCGPYAGYYGVCEPSGCSLGRKDMGAVDCPKFAIGAHCCRPYTENELLKAITPIDAVGVPLLYPGLNSVLKISVSLPRDIVYPEYTTSDVPRGSRQFE